MIFTMSTNGAIHAYYILTLTQNTDLDPPHAPVLHYNVSKLGIHYIPVHNMLHEGYVTMQ